MNTQGRDRSIGGSRRTWRLDGAAPALPSREFVYSDGLPGSGLLATLTGGSSPTVTYFHDDHLSWRISTDGTPGSPTYGQVNGSQGSYPFGDSWYSSNGNEFAFTSYQRDSESGLDYAMARYYDSTAARFCSADPVGGQLDDPQTWDRYSYVRNDPINLTDPNGQSWLNWVIDAIVTALVIALPELAPEEFSFLGGSSAAVDGTSWALSTGKIASLGTGIIGTETVTTSSLGLGIGIAGGANAASAGSATISFSNVSQSGPQQKLIGDRLGQVKDKLAHDSKCNDFLAGKGADPSKIIDKLISTNQYAHADITEDGNPFINTAVSSGGPSTPAITINNQGGFFNLSAPNGEALPQGPNHFPGGSPKAQALTLLHELGHLAGVLKDDAGLPGVVNSNNKAVLSHCKTTISSF